MASTEMTRLFVKNQIGVLMTEYFMVCCKKYIFSFSQLEAKNPKLCSKDETFQAISYENIITAFMILPFGVITAFAVLMMEKILQRF